MKRHGFSGLPASHGVSLAHRSAGSIGQNTNPAKVWKGKKMAGNMGGNKITTVGLRVMRIDTEKSTLFVIGNVPGKNGKIVTVSDSLKKFVWEARRRSNLRLPDVAEDIQDIPFPAGTPELDTKIPRIITWKGEPLPLPRASPQ